MESLMHVLNKKNMNVYVYSRSAFDHLIARNFLEDSNVEGVKNTIFISILSSKALPHSVFHEPVFKEPHPNVLTVTFDDVIDEDGNAVFLNAWGQGVKDKGTPITEDQAAEIVDFVLNHRDKEYAFVHCAAGISRSGAVGSFIADVNGVDYDTFKRMNPQIHENRHVKNLLNKIYRETHG